MDCIGAALLAVITVALAQRSEVDPLLPLASDAELLDYLVRTEQAGGALGLPWAQLPAGVESAHICELVRRARSDTRNHGRAGHMGGYAGLSAFRVAETVARELGGVPPRSVEPNRTHFYNFHIAKSGGVAFTVHVLGQLSESYSPSMLVDAPEIQYPDSRRPADALRRRLGKLLVEERQDLRTSTPARLASFRSREIRSGSLHELWEDFSRFSSQAGETTPWTLALFRRPDEREASHFHHDTVHDPQRTACSNNPEEQYAKCCRPTGIVSLGKSDSSCGCKLRCELHTNLVTRGIGLEAARRVTFVGLTENYDLSICLFLHTFSLLDKFQRRCLQTGFAPRMHVFNSAAEQSGLSLKRQRLEEVYSRKVRPKYCGEVCRGGNLADYYQWVEAAHIFWARVWSIMDFHGVSDFQCPRPTSM